MGRPKKEVATKEVEAKKEATEELPQGSNGIWVKITKEQAILLQKEERLIGYNEDETGQPFGLVR
jgi:hypothetical protein